MCEHYIEVMDAFVHPIFPQCRMVEVAANTEIESRPSIAPPKRQVYEVLDLENTKSTLEVSFDEGLNCIIGFHKEFNCS